MARDREPYNSEEYESESGEEEEEESDEEEASSKSDSELQNLVVRDLSPPPPVLKSQPQSSSMIQRVRVKKQSESGSETETDSRSGSETESDAPGHKASKKSNGVANEPKPRPRVPEAVTLVRFAGVKRSADEKEASKDSKRPKMKPPLPELENSKKSNDDSKKQLFQRLWSQDDEIVILKGMIDYTEKNKSDPITDLNAFHIFIKDNLHVDVSRNQLQDKIRRLKKKYENNRSKEKEGKDRTFSKPHEQKAYELSRHIWGNDNGRVESNVKVNGSTVRKSQKNNNEFEDVKNVQAVNWGEERAGSMKMMRSSDVSINERIFRIGSELFDGKSRVVEGGREWRQLMLHEMELHMKMLEVMHARTKLVSDVLKSRDQ